MKRSALKRSTKPLQRKARLKARKAGSLFPKRRDPAYQQWVRENFPCWFCKSDNRTQTLQTECEHLKTRGSGGSDFDNILPTCGYHRARRDILGPKTFFSGYPNVWLAAQKLTALYRATVHE